MRWRQMPHAYQTFQMSNDGGWCGSMAGTTGSAVWGGVRKQDHRTDPAMERSRSPWWIFARFRSEGANTACGRRMHS